MKSLVKHFDNRESAIITSCYIAMPEGTADANGDRRYCLVDNAAWDTGATNTIISPAIVDSLGLKPTGRASVSSYGGFVETCTYTVNLYFENGYKIENLEVMSGDYCDYDVLIGMDVITLGDFCISTLEDKTTFSFRIPSKGIIVDE